MRYAGVQLFVLFLKQLLAVFLSFAVLWPSYGDNSDIFQAIRNNNVELVESLISEDKTVVHLMDEYGHRPLDVAINFYRSNSKDYEIVLGKRKKIIDILINNGADLEADLKDGWHDGTTPFLRVVNVNIDIAEHLAKRGADIHATDDSGQTALHITLNGAGWERAHEMLLRNGADVHARDDLCRTPLHLASFYNLLDEALMLIDHGAKLDAVAINSYPISHGGLDNVSFFLLRNTLGVCHFLHNLPDIAMKTPLEEARSSEMRELLLNAEEVENTQL